MPAGDCALYGNALRSPYFFVMTTVPEKLRTERIALASPKVPRTARLGRGRRPRSPWGWSRSVMGKSLGCCR